MNLLAIVVALVAAFIALPDRFITDFWPNPAGSPGWATIDHSWILAMNYAKIHGLTWGTDFVFTYGPLAPLCTRLSLGENGLAFLLFDLFMFANYFLIFFLAFKQSKNKIFTFLAIAAAVVALPIWVGTASTMVLLFMLVFWIRMGLDEPKPLYYAFQIAIVTLLFFIKFNTGLIVFVLYFAGIAYNLRTRKVKSWYLFGYTVLPVLLVVVLAQLFEVALFSYIRSGIEMVIGYNDIMYTKIGHPSSRTYFRIIFILLLVIICANIYKKKNEEKLKMWLILFLFGVPVYVLYKQSFVRADDGHIVDFFLYTPMVVLCNVDISRHLRNHIVKVLFIAVLALPIYYLSAKMHKPLMLKEKLSKTAFLGGYSKFTPDASMRIVGQGIQLPASVKRKIRRATVDVYPWNIQMLMENRLNYLPRPVCQSYSAYTPYLEDLNFEHYNNVNTAPQFVIYDYTNLDDRYLLFDESKLNLALNLNYFLAEQFDYDGRKLLLLQKKPDFRPIRLEKIRTYDARMELPLIPKENVYYEIGLQQSLLGKLYGIYEHAPAVKLAVYLKGADVRRYKTGTKLLQTGIFSTSYVGTIEDCALFFAHQPTQYQVKYYKFRGVKKDMFKEEKTITEYKIKQ
ncbi:MAG TPA: hypothetical protein VK528_12715 [Flavobacterium sp.]|nr:hypothetical protein [Flavobacterium sp.]